MAGRPPKPFEGIYVPPWMPENYGEMRKFVWGNNIQSLVGSINKQFVRVEKLTFPTEFAIHLRIVNDKFPLVAQWQTTFGVQGGNVTVNLFNGNHVVFGDSLYISLIQDYGGFPGAGPAIGFASPAPGSPIGWQEG